MIKILVAITIMLAGSLFVPPVHSFVNNVAANAVGGLTTPNQHPSGANANSQPSLTTNTTTNANENSSTSVGSTQTNATAQTQSNKVAADIAAAYHVSVSEVIKLHESGWGYGEINILYALAKTSGRSVTEIKAMRDSGLGWGVIAAKLNLNLGHVRPHLGEIVSGHFAGGAKK